MQRFNPSSPHAARAVQAWQILVGLAMNRQTITYASLAQVMYRHDAAGVLSHILGHIAFYCIDNELPPLTAIVVGHGGMPGPKIPIDLSKLNEERERAYCYDWYDVHPPSARELHEAFESHAKSPNG